MHIVRDQKAFTTLSREYFDLPDHNLHCPVLFTEVLFKGLFLRFADERADSDLRQMYNVSNHGV